MIYLGIDPGASGGIGILRCENSSIKATALRMPDTERDLWDLLKEYGTPTIRHPSSGSTCYAVLEKVGGIVCYTGDKKGMGHSMFQFGKSYGLCYMALIAAGIPFDLVAPQTWQKEFAIKRDKGTNHSQWKGRLKGVAQRLFPHLRVTLSIGDALLLAEYARRSQRVGVR